MLSFLGWFMYNPYQNKTMFMYIFLASFRSQERELTTTMIKATATSTNNWFYEQNNDFVLTHASHFFDIHSTVEVLWSM